MRWLFISALLLTACSRQPSEAEIQAAMNVSLTATSVSITATAAAQPTAIPTPDPCSTEAIALYGKTVKSATDIYFAQLDIAQSTPRISLGPALQNLFGAEQAVSAVTPPPCLADWFGRTKNMMELFRTSLNQFAAQDDDANANLLNAIGLRTVVETGLLDILAGRVPVLP